MTFSGSCLCGTVRYRVEGSFDSFYLCHCQRCRKDTGSAHAANLLSTRATLQWLSGTASINRYRVPGTLHSKAFCRTCGSALPNLQMEGQLLLVPAGSLDDAPPLTADAHIFLAHKATWDHALEKLPGFPAGPNISDKT